MSSCSPCSMWCTFSNLAKKEKQTKIFKQHSEIHLVCHVEPSSSNSQRWRCCEKGGSEGPKIGDAASSSAGRRYSTNLNVKPEVVCVRRGNVLSRSYLYAESWLWQLVCGGLCFTVVSVAIHSCTVCIQCEFIRCFGWTHCASLDVIYMLTQLVWTASVARGTGLSSYYFII